MLNAGTKLGPYEIVAPLGAGGMGEVYKARDTRLDRTVAIKVLSPALATDPGLRERFDREARVISSLSHPHICPLFDVGDHQGTAFLVMELLDGETLEARLAQAPGLKGPGLGVDEALRLAIHIASALDAAHRAGVVHRDLKPGNVMLTRAGAKLLDFGLAKASAPAVAGPAGSMLPTTPQSLTGQGAILGTFQYMAPEQIEGMDADARTDLFAFGCVLYEMLTGRKAFEGKTRASLLGAIMHADPPPISTLQPLTPPALDRLVRKCLAKEPDERWQSAKDLHDELKWIAEATETTDPHVRSLQALASSIARPRWRRPAELVAGAIFVAAATAVVTWSVTRSGPAPARPLTRFALTLDSNQQFQNRTRPLVALSPDGTRLVYVATQRLYLRALDQLDAVSLRGAEGGTSPFFSPDGQWIGFWLSGQLRKVSVAGGPPVTVCAMESAPLGGVSWGADDTIVFGRGGNEIWRVSGTGGTPEALIKADAGQSVYGPQILPGGRAVLFTQWVDGSWDRAQIVVQSLDTKRRHVVIQGGRDARYLPTGHLTYVTGDTLLAVPFDIAALKVTGGPVPLMDGILTGGNGSGAAHFGVSRTGVLVYVPATAERTMMVWLDRLGREQPVAAEPRPYRYPRISPDGARVAIEAGDQDDDIWIWEFARATLTRLTSTPQRELSPLWSSDGRHVLFQSSPLNGANLYRQSADGTGTAERLTTSPNRHLPYALTPDGKTLVFGELDQAGHYELRVMSMEGDHASKSLLTAAFSQHNADLSPDGRLIVFESDQSGRDEVYVRPFPRVDDGRWQISVGGGRSPVWARSGRELFYLDPSGDMMAVAVQSQSGFSAGNPTRLFDASAFLLRQAGPGRHFDIASDGRFLMLKPSAGNNDAARLIVVENWFEELKARVPTR